MPDKGNYSTGRATFAGSDSDRIGGVYQMDLGMALLLICIMYPMILFVYLFVKMGVTPKKGVYFGVTLTSELAKEQKVKEVSHKYYKEMKRWLLILLLMPLPMFLIPWVSIWTLYFVFWLGMSCVAFFIPFGVANHRLKTWKLERGFVTDVEPVIYTELKQAGAIRRVKWFHFAPQTFLSVVAVVVAVLIHKQLENQLLLLMTGIFGCITFLYWLAAIWMDRQKTMAVSTDSDVNVNYARAKKNLWKNFWVGCSWVHVAYIVVQGYFLLEGSKITLSIWVLAILYTVATLVLLFWMLHKKAGLDKRYEDKIDILRQDTDDYYLWGLIYYNPHDKHSMVESRNGIGTNTNLATPVGKGVVILIVAIALHILILCLSTVVQEFTPIQLQIEGGYVVASHTKEEYRIALYSIKEVQLLTERERPKMICNHGWNTDTLVKGSFRLKEEKKDCEVMGYDYNTLFLRIDTSVGTYFFSGATDEETRQVYEAIRKGR